MLMMNKPTIQFDGVSLINDEIAAVFSASYQGKSELYFNMKIYNISLFSTNSIAVKNDYDIFVNKSLSAITEKNITPVITTTF